MDPVAVQLTLPLAGCVEDFQLQVSAPCRAANRELLNVGNDDISAADRPHNFIRLIAVRACDALVIFFFAAWSRSGDIH